MGQSRAISAVECKHLLSSTYKLGREILALVYNASSCALSCYEGYGGGCSMSPEVRGKLCEMSGALSVAVDGITRVLKSVFKDYDERLYRKQETESLYSLWQDVYQINEKLKRYQRMLSHLLNAAAAA